MLVWRLNDLELMEAAAAGPQAAAKRRRRANRKPPPLTEKQIEAMHLVAEHKGNYTAAGAAAGKSRQAMEKLYRKATKKLGTNPMKAFVKAHSLPTDHRGQICLAESED
jgi:hypothetical protein